METVYGGAWLECNGVAVSRTTYAALNSLLSGLSYPFGSGNGSTTFTLPDLRGRNVTMHATGSGHADVNGLGDSDGLSLANRTPKDTINISVTISGTTSGPDDQAQAQSGPTLGLATNAHDHTFSGSDSDSDTVAGNYLVTGVWFIKALT